MAIDRSDLNARLLGFLFFLPILLPVLAGYPFIVLGTGFAALWVIYEAVQLLGQKVSFTRKWVASGVLLLIFSLPFLVFNQLLATQIAGVIGLVLMAAAMILLNSSERVFIFLLGCTIFSLSYLSLLPEGAQMLIFIAIVISASDIGAYFSGRLIGGPKLAPALSPSKTWAGSIGGIVSALLVTEMLIIWMLERHLDSRIAGFVLLIAVVSQIGDLFESSMKRRLGIKDSSKFVPGHGGALDRFDGYMTTLPLIVLMLVGDLAFIDIKALLS